MTESYNVGTKSHQANHITCQGQVNGASTFSKGLLNPTPTRLLDFLMLNILNIVFFFVQDLESTFLSINSLIKILKLVMCVITFVNCTCLRKVLA